MVFNIASAGLVWTDYQQNSTNVQVSYTEFALSLTELILIVITWFSLLNTKNVIYSLSLLIVEAFNIAYSSYIIEYYNSSNLLPMRIINMTLAIIILNCLTLCGCCIGVHLKVEESADKMKTGMKNNVLSQI